MVNYYKTIINNLIDLFCGMVCIEDWDMHDWIDFLKTIGFSPEDIANFLVDGNLS